MLAEKDLANKRALERKINEIRNLLHEIGGTRRGTTRFASPELAYADKAARETAHWVRDHYFTNASDKAAPTLVRKDA